MLRYPALFKPDESWFTISFRDIPEALTSGEDMEEARFMAADALLTSMDFYFNDRRPVPAPSKLRKGEELVALPSSVAAKILLLNEMLSQNVSPAELARRMSTTPQKVDRMMRLDHATTIDTIAAALDALGKSLELRVV